MREEPTPVSPESPPRAFSRREWLRAAGGVTVIGSLGAWRWPQGASQALPRMTVHKSPTCGCCGKWIEHVQKAGFSVTEHNMDDVTPVKKEKGVPEQLYSCHTTVVGDYVIEGHVPADLVKRVLREHPAILGLSAPGMPQSAPGMDQGNEKYDVVSFTKQGRTAVYATRP
jgi:hypothetical protein